MKRIILIPILLSTFLLVGCESDLIQIANEERIIKFSKIYDCRDQGRSPWGDSPHSKVVVHLIDFTNKTELVHIGYYKNTILGSPFDYSLLVETTEDHIFEQEIYDLQNINETKNFIRFSAVNEKGKKSDFVINKKTNELIYDQDLAEEWREKITGLTVTEEWVKKNSGLSWSKECKKI